MPQRRRPGHDTWGEGLVEVHRPHQRLGADVARRGARAAVPAGQHAEQRLLRRPPPGRESVRRIARLPRRGHRAARKWHFQIVHHGLWDYDLPSAPDLVTITRRRAQRVDAVVQLTKQGFAFVVRSRDRQAGLADRGAAGAAERRPRRAGLADAAVSDPAPRRLSPQGVSLDDAFDLTPALKRSRRAELPEVPARAAVHAACHRAR